MNFCLQGPKDWLLRTHGKAAKYRPSLYLIVYHYPEQKDSLYYIDMEDG